MHIIHMSSTVSSILTIAIGSRAAGQHVIRPPSFTPLPGDIGSVLTLPVLLALRFLLVIHLRRQHHGWQGEGQQRHPPKLPQKRARGRIGREGEDE